jgi:hypothetical protein
MFATGVMPRSQWSNEPLQRRAEAGRCQLQSLVRPISRVGSTARFHLPLEHRGLVSIAQPVHDIQRYP